MTTKRRVSTDPLPPSTPVEDGSSAAVSEPLEPQTPSGLQADAILRALPNAPDELVNLLVTRWNTLCSEERNKPRDAHFEHQATDAFHKLLRWYGKITAMDVMGVSRKSGGVPDSLREAMSAYVAQTGAYALDQYIDAFLSAIGGNASDVYNQIKEL